MNSMKSLHAVLVTALAFTLAAGSVRAGGTDSHRAVSYQTENSDLLIKRAANFGNHSNINLFIDGQRVASLTYGRSYRGVLPAGLHLVTMQQTPHLNDAYPYSQQWIRIRPGQPNVFTAIWRGGGTRIALEQS